MCAATGGSFPPHEVDAGIPGDCFQCGDEYSRSKYPGLFAFLEHSDCDGDIDADMCMKVAEDLESLIPKMESLSWQSHGHIAAQ